MRALRQIPSWLAMAAAAAIMGLPIIGDPSAWRDRVFDPPTFLMAFTLIGVAILLWPYREPETVQR
jgi:peptidoglycan/LPS O-acetylase OafA/YrhL